MEYVLGLGIQRSQLEINFDGVLVCGLFQTFLNNRPVSAIHQIMTFCFSLLITNFEPHSPLAELSADPLEYILAAYSIPKLRAVQDSRISQTPLLGDFASSLSSTSSLWIFAPSASAFPTFSATIGQGKTYTQ